MRISMSAHHFIQSLAEHEVADLRAHIHCLHGRSCQGITETNGSISSPSSGYQ